MLKEVIEKRLNDQVNRELYSAYLYYSMAAYFDAMNLAGFTHWMKVQAQEEVSHAERIFHYIGERGGRVALAPIEAPPTQWDSPLDAMECAYKHECSVTELYNQCVTLVLQENDHPTNTLLQWFVAEQIEEEASADAVLQKLKLIGSDSSGLFLLDGELQKRVFVPPAAGGDA